MDVVDTEGSGFTQTLVGGRVSDLIPVRFEIGFAYGFGEFFCY